MRRMETPQTLGFQHQHFQVVAARIQLGHSQEAQSEEEEKQTLLLPPDLKAVHHWDG
jgi:hypothetical protein